MLFFIAVVIPLFFVIQILSLLWILADEGSGKLHWLLGSQVKRQKQIQKFEGQTPKVSVLLAARNEEALILRSLESISQLDYPKECLEILIGDDDSTDKTAQLIDGFIQDKPHFKRYSITETLGKGRGKANVLAHLAHHASGAFYFITDVDVRLPEQWINGMLRQFTDEVGIASGITCCEKGSLFANLQSVDWLHFMGYIKAFAKVGIGCTSVGNNMAVRAKAYWETGGYEKIDFSITEDYKLFKEVTANGWKWSNQLQADTLGYAWYIKDLIELLHQRKRWLIGARELPVNWKLMIILYGLFVPALVLLFFINPMLAMWTWFLKFIAQSLFISVLCAKLKVRPFRFSLLLTYEVYVLLTTVATAFFYFLPIPSRWKGRTYNKHYID